MESQGYKPNFVNIKCSWHIVLLHVHEKTLEDADYIFTSVDIHKTFGCSTNSAIRIINKGVVIGTFLRTREIKGKPYHFKLTEHGKNNAVRLIKRQLAEDEINAEIGR